MKKILYNKPKYYCTISSQQNFPWKEHKLWSETEVSNFKLELKGLEWNVMWPNREGETFCISAVFSAVKKYSAPGGLKITYPSTASCRTLIFLEDSGCGFAFMASPDSLGRVTEFLINSKHRTSFTLNIKGNKSSWYFIPFKNFEELEDKIKILQESSFWTKLPAGKTDAKWQVQVGLIGPDGSTSIPESRGFDVLSDISKLLQSYMGDNNILHIFGYSMGHDTGYPDYTPSTLLGGKTGLEKAISCIHKNGQKAVFYLNGRIAQIENVESDSLYDSSLRDDRGIPLTEIYHGRNFYVMNPSSIQWQERLFLETMRLKELGADGVQLDQLGGRAALVPPGGIWGEGYINLIKRIHKENLSVWIQGLSDIYPADWFELTYRDINVLEDGTIRGGTPLGKPDKTVFKLSVPDQILLVPFSKLESNDDLKSENIIIDLNKGRGELFLYGPDYMPQLESMMLKAVSNF